MLNEVRDISFRVLSDQFYTILGWSYRSFPAILHDGISQTPTNTYIFVVSLILQNSGHVLLLFRKNIIISRSLSIFSKVDQNVYAWLTNTHPRQCNRSKSNSSRTLTRMRIRNGPMDTSQPYNYVCDFSRTRFTYE